MKKEESLIEKLLNIKKIFCDIERNNNFFIENRPENNLTSYENEFDDIFLISCTWCNKALAFIEECTNKYSMRSIGDLFEINKFITKFSIFENESRKINNTFGIYPGPINNFGLLKGKNHWIDINNSENGNYFNLYVSNTIKENQDFYILTKDQWNLVNDIFGNIYEIRRRYFPKAFTYEIFPKEVKIIHFIHLFKFK